MKIQKGMVKYKDRNDIICVYGVTDDGKTYYFLNSNGDALVNGSQIVSTELVEAIDPMYKASKVGIIDSLGKEVIACENKGIKLIADDIVLVEKAIPTTESVLQAIEFRSDSLHAAQLVSTPAQIKDNIYREMGNDGRFLFNDQFAEATIYDIDGNNLVDNEVYSFIAINNNQLYLSKNLPDSPVVHFALDDKKVVNSESTESDEVALATDNGIGEQIDVGNVNVSIADVDNALEGQESPENVIQDNFDIDTHAMLENINEGLDIPSVDEFMAATNLGIPIVKADDEIPTEEVVEEPTESVVPEKVSEEVVEEPTDGVVQEEVFEEVVEEPTEGVVQEEVFEEVVEDPLAEEDIQSLLNETSMDLFNGTPLQIDSIVSDSDDVENYSFVRENSGDENLFNDLAKSMASLMKQNREQRATIANYEGIIDGLKNDGSEMQGKITEFENTNVELSDRNRALENAVIKLKTRIEMLTTKLQEKEQEIIEQANELEGLRPQLEGKEQLLGLLRDAQALILDENVTEDEEDYGYAKAA